MNEFNLPLNAAERHKLLKEDQTGETLERIKQAAKKKISRSNEIFIERWFRQAKIWDEDDLSKWKRAAILCPLGVALIFGLIGASWDISTALFAAAGGLLIGSGSVLAWLQHLVERERRKMALSMIGIIEQLLPLLSLGYDLTTTLQQLIKSNLYDVENHVVLNPIQISLEESEGGTPILEALRGVAYLVDHEPFYQLTQCLVLTEQFGTEWKTQLESLHLALLDEEKILVPDRDKRSTRSTKIKKIVRKQKKLYERVRRN